MTSRNENQRGRFWRKQLIVPTEHGSWSWFLVPYAVGAYVSSAADFSLLLTLVGGLSIFLMRQPATVWLRARRGRARAADGPFAAAWVLLLALVAALCLLGLLLLQRAPLLWLLVPLVPIFALYMLAARYGRAGLRSLWMGLTGAAALAMMAPAALVTARGGLTGEEWTLWTLMAAQNVLGALYVRLRISDTRNRPIKRIRTLWAHLTGLGVVVILSLVTTPSLWVALPFLGFLVRAIWAVRRSRPIPNVKRFGFTEIGVEIAGGMWIAAVYWLS